MSDSVQCEPQDKRRVLQLLQQKTIVLFIIQDTSDIKIDCYTEDRIKNEKICNISAPFMRAKTQVRRSFFIVTENEMCAFKILFFILNNGDENNWVYLRLSVVCNEITGNELTQNVNKWSINSRRCQQILECPISLIVSNFRDRLIHFIHLENVYNQQSTGNVCSFLKKIKKYII